MMYLVGAVALLLAVALAFTLVDNRTLAQQVRHYEDDEYAFKLAADLCTKSGIPYSEAVDRIQHVRRTGVR